MADHGTKTWFFESVLDPSVMWVDLKNIDFAEGSGARTIPLGSEPRLAGEVSAGFKPAAPMVWMALRVGGANT